MIPTETRQNATNLWHAVPPSPNRGPTVEEPNLPRRVSSDMHVVANPSMSLPASQLGEAPESADLPRVMGRYVLLERIGRGGLSEVFFAVRRADVLQKRVAIKRVRSDLSETAAAARVLQTESALAARLRDHPNLVRIFERGTDDDGRDFLVMEYVEGLDLRSLLVRLSRAGIGLPADHALLIVDRVLKGLEHLHRLRDDNGYRLGFIHRDISPSNILLSFDGDVKLCDYGIATATLSADGNLIRDASPVAGKAAYMSPEHAKGEPIDARADLFSVAAVMWQLFAGRRMIRGTPEEMLVRAREGHVPSMPAGRSVPKAELLEEILRRGLARERHQRFLTATDFRQAVDSYAKAAGLKPDRARFGAFLSSHFAADVVDVRRELERLVEPLVRWAPSDHSAIRPIALARPRRRLWPFAVGILAGCLLAASIGIAFWPF